MLSGIESEVAQLEDATAVSRGPDIDPDALDGDADSAADEAPKGDTEVHCYQYLIESMEDYVERTRERKVTAAQAKLIQQRISGAPRKIEHDLVVPVRKICKAAKLEQVRAGI